MLKPGTYVLPCDVTNPEPDRRHKRDWREFPVWKKGEEFVVEQDARDSGTVYTRIMLVGHRWTHQAIGPGHEAKYSALEAALVPSDETLDAMFTALRVDDRFARWLLEAERLDRETFRRLWAEFYDGEEPKGPWAIGPLRPVLVKNERPAETP